MKKTACCLLTLITTTFCAGELVAATTMLFPKTIQILAVNGKEISHKRGSIQLPDGDNQLLVRLVADVGKNSDAEMEYSDLIILSFSATNSQLQLVAPKIKRTLDMRSFNRKTDLKLLTADGTPMPFAKDKLIKEGFQLGRDYEQELAAYNQSNAPAALTSIAAAVQDQQATVKPESNAPPSSSADTPRQIKQKAPQAESSPVNSRQPEADAAMAKKMLRYWYEKADEKTRQDFLQNLKENN